MVQANFLREPQFSLRTQWERIFSLFSFRAFCSTWQGLSALPHTRVWQSSRWPCQQLQGCLALSDESVGNLVQYCIGFNLVQYCIGFNLLQYCIGFNLVQYCTGFNLVQYCFVLILKFFQECLVSRALHVSSLRLRHAVNSLQSPPCGLGKDGSRKISFFLSKRLLDIILDTTMLPL